MRVLSLLAGMGGFDLAFEMAGFDVVAQVEIDSYCQRILRHHFPQAKLYGDIRRVTGEQITGDCGAIDVVCGGFPCQDISQAGKGAGREGKVWHNVLLTQCVSLAKAVDDYAKALKTTEGES